MQNAEHVTHVEQLSARQVGLELLCDVLDRKQALDQSLENSTELLALPTRDRAFARMLVATTLRRLGQIDDLITRLQDRPDAMPHAMIHHILRLGMCQIFFMNVADHAAVDTCVQLAEKNGFDRYKGFVNAILRSALRAGPEMIAKQDPVRLNTPEWLLKSWIADYGLGEAAKIAEANLSEAAIDITLKDESTRNFWSAEFKAINVPTGSIRLPKGPGHVAELPGYDDGMWFVQDAAAAIPVMLLGDVRDQTIVDLCAAPGGKTAQLASKGAHVIAIDRSANRLKRLKENLHRLRLEDRAEVIVTDAAHWKPAEPPQKILLDAPCSATGTMRRHPDLAHLKSPEDIARLCDIQMRLLENAFEILAPGGTLIYCTCSLQKAEGEDQIRNFLGKYENASRQPVHKDEIGGLEELITADEDVRIFPYHMVESGGMDGFFISRIVKLA